MTSADEPSSGVFITRLPAAHAKVRLAVKDLIDVAGVLTTAGSRVVAERAAVATTDARCLQAARRHDDVAIVGKTNLVELAFGATGINPWYGTPANPIDGSKIPGGSSSGSAVAVAIGAADVAIGTDTGGSIRIPSACCATAGLKTTFGLISVEGVRPLAPSLDTVGPMARSVEGLMAGMSLLDEGFQPVRSAATPPTIGRVELSAHDEIEAEIDRALNLLGWRMTRLHLRQQWAEAWRNGNTVICSEAAASNADLLGELARIDPLVAVRLIEGAALDADQVTSARAFARRWTAKLTAALERADLIVTPTLIVDPPTLAEAPGAPMSFATMPVNMAGLPALSLPLRGLHGRIPVSVQLIGPPRSEAALLWAGEQIEQTLTDCG
jgi:amidase